MDEPPAGGVAENSAENQPVGPSPEGTSGRARLAWGLAAALWFAGASGFWGWYLNARAEDGLRRGRDAETARLVAAIDRRAAAGPLPDGPTVDVARLSADLAALEYERFADVDRRRAQAFLAHRLTSLGYAPELQSFRTGINVVGERAGSGAGGASAGVVLIAAHLDTVEGSPGADDNATGLVVALEMARLFAEAGGAPRRTLRIAFFDREEAGLEGSLAYVRAADRTAGLRAVIVLEMLGATCHTPGCQRFPEGLNLPLPTLPTTGDFLAALGNDADPTLLPLLVRASRPGLPAVLALPVLEAGRDLPDSRRSDHAPFWDIGLPAVMLTDTADLRSTRYHQSTDTLDGVDLKFLSGNAQVLSNALAALLALP